MEECGGLAEIVVELLAPLDTSNAEPLDATTVTALLGPAEQLIGSINASGDDAEKARRKEASELLTARSELSAGWQDNLSEAPGPAVTCVDRRLADQSGRQASAAFFSGAQSFAMRAYVFESDSAAEAAVNAVALDELEDCVSELYELEAEGEEKAHAR